eukprot:TRINITY_DN2550_c0_g2_i2.p1 TRINITY_DN2550_c0_g2~~TRINITY_DN2550_c0_g2_i2.p1  ORF type:complete len:547 (-),score=157.45 TRINITY_DN2550_c0_g2_i2:323-1780(-)
MSDAFVDQSELMYNTEHLTKQVKKLAPKFDAGSYWVPKKTTTPQTPSFQDAYTFLLENVPSTYDTLKQLERSYTAALSDIQQRGDIAVRNLQKRHSEEMENASRTHHDPSKIGMLVANHVEEMERTEKMWQQEQIDLRDRQKLEYRAFVIEFYSVESRRLAEQGSHSTSSMPSDASTPSIQDLKPTIKNGPFPPVRISGNNSKKSSWKVPFRKKREKEDDISVVLPEVIAPMSEKLERAIEETTTIVIPNSHQAHLYTPQGRLYTIRLTSLPIFQLEFNLNDKDVLVSPSHVYSNSLRGVIVYVDPNLNYNAKGLKEFSKMCDAATEFHFDTFDAQLTSIKSKISSDPLSVGDFFVTRHTNLGNVNVVFHLVVSPTKNFSPEISPNSPEVFGLKNIFATAATYDVEFLTFSGIFVETGDEISIFKLNPDLNWIQPRCDFLLKMIREFLQSDEGSDIKGMQMSFPGIPSDVFLKLKTGISENFRTL